MSAQGQQVCVALQSAAMGQPCPWRVNGGKELAMEVAQKLQISP